MICLAVFSLVNGGQRWFDERNLELGPFAAFAWDAIPLLGFALAAMLALGRGGANSTSLMRAPRGHDPLLVLRAFACFMVLGGHGVGFSFAARCYVNDLAVGEPLWLIAPSPQCGVWIFFVLSGYLIGKGFNSGRYIPSRESAGRFLVNRCLRIFPVFWLMTGSVLVIADPSIFAPRNLAVFFNDMALNVDGRYAFIPIGALWSISTEMQFYILAPMIVIVLRLRHASLSACLGIAIAAVALETTLRIVVVARFGTQGWFDALYMPLAGNIDLFLLGMLASRIVIIGKGRGWRLSSGLSAGWLVMLLLYGSMGWLYTHALTLNQQKPAYIFAAFATSISGMASALAIFCFEMAPPYSSTTSLYRWLRPIEMIGVLTYAIYSLHEPLFLLVKHHLHQPQTFTASLLEFMAVCIILLVPSLAINRWVEQPFLRMKWQAGLDAPDSAPALES